MLWKPILFGSAKNKNKNPPPHTHTPTTLFPSLRGLGNFLKTSKLGLSPSSKAHLHSALLAEKPTGWLGGKSEFDSILFGTEKQGRAGQRLAVHPQGPPPLDPCCPFLFVSVGGASQSDLASGLTVPKCVTFSIVRDGWFYGGHGSLCSLRLPCTKSVRK